jgi:hypothetical protein
MDNLMKNRILGWRVVNKNKRKQHLVKYTYDGDMMMHCNSPLIITDKKMLATNREFPKCKICEKEVMRLLKLNVSCLE